MRLATEYLHECRLLPTIADMEIESLNWAEPIAVQEAAVQHFSELDPNELSRLIQPGSKSLWENAARALVRSGYEHNKHLLPKMFDWLQDMNWPGATLISDYLSSLDENSLHSGLTYAVNKAITTDDRDWLRFIREFCLKNSIDVEHYVIEENRNEFDRFKSRDH